MLADIQDKQDQLSNQPSAEEATGSISLLDLAEILDQHKIWVETGGESGVKADLCGVNLSHSDLTGVNLEGAFIQRANLIGADLSMANLRGASLVQADLREKQLALVNQQARFHFFGLHGIQNFVEWHGDHFDVGLEKL